jgi:hypothetical protein
VPHLLPLEESTAEQAELAVTAVRVGTAEPAGREPTVEKAELAGRVAMAAPLVAWCLHRIRNRIVWSGHMLRTPVEQANSMHRPHVEQKDKSNSTRGRRDNAPSECRLRL